MSNPDPLYKVSCAMCPKSLHAESHNLKELFNIAKAHLKEEHDHATGKDKAEIERILNSENQNSAVFNSWAFRWSVTDMTKFDTIEQKVKKDIDSAIGKHNTP